MYHQLTTQPIEDWKPKHKGGESEVNEYAALLWMMVGKKKKSHCVNYGKKRAKKKTAFDGGCIRLELE